MSTKKLLPRAVAEKFFVSISSPLPAGMSLDCSRGSSLDCSSVSLGSFSSGDNVRRLLKLGKRSDFGNHGSIGGSWPMAISGSPRGHSVITVTRCRSTQGRTTYLILPSNRASQEPNRPPPRRMERALYQRRSPALESVTSPKGPIVQVAARLRLFQKAASIENPIICLEPHMAIHL